MSTPLEIAQEIGIAFWAPRAHFLDDKIHVGEAEEKTAGDQVVRYNVYVEEKSDKQEQFHAYVDGDVKTTLTMESLVSENTTNLRLYEHFDIIAALGKDLRNMRFFLKLLMHADEGEHAAWATTPLKRADHSALKKVLRKIDDTMTFRGHLEAKAKVVRPPTYSSVMMLIRSLTDPEFRSYEIFPEILMTTSEWKVYIQAVQQGYEFTPFEYEFAVKMLKRLPDVGLKLDDHCPLGMLKAYERIRIEKRIPERVFIIVDQDLFHRTFRVEQSRVKSNMEDEDSTEDIPEVHVNEDTPRAPHMRPSIIQHMVEACGMEDAVKELLVIASLFPCYGINEQAAFLDDLQDEINFDYTRDPNEYPQSTSVSRSSSPAPSTSTVADQSDDEMQNEIAASEEIEQPLGDEDNDDDDDDGNATRAANGENEQLLGDEEDGSVADGDLEELSRCKECYMMGYATCGMERGDDDDYHACGLPRSARHPQNHYRTTLQDSSQLQNNHKAERANMANSTTPVEKQFHVRDLPSLTPDHRDGDENEREPLKWRRHPFDAGKSQETDSIIMYVAYEPEQIVSQLSKIFARTSATQRFLYWPWNFDRNGEFRLHGTLSQTDLDTHASMWGLVDETGGLPNSEEDLQRQIVWDEEVYRRMLSILEVSSRETAAEELRGTGKP